MARAGLVTVAFALLALAYLGVQWWGAEPRPAREDLPPVEHGAQIFAEHCAPCHGARGEGEVGPRLVLENKERFRGALLIGFYPMPSFEGVLTEEEIDALWAYVSSLPAP